MRGITTLGRGKGRSRWEPPKGGGGGALRPDVWYPTIPGSPEEKDLGSLIQPRRGGGDYCSSLPKPYSRGRFQRTILHLTILNKYPTSRVHPLLTKRPIFIVRLEARERKKDRLGEGCDCDPNQLGSQAGKTSYELPLKQARLPQEGVLRGREV